MLVVEIAKVAARYSRCGLSVDGNFFAPDCSAANEFAMG